MPTEPKRPSSLPGFLFSEYRTHQLMLLLVCDISTASKTSRQFKIRAFDITFYRLNNNSILRTPRRNSSHLSSWQSSKQRPIKSWNRAIPLPENFWQDALGRRKIFSRAKFDAAVNVNRTKTSFVAPWFPLLRVTHSPVLLLFCNTSMASKTSRQFKIRTFDITFY